MTTFREAVPAVKQATDIVDYIQRAGIKLQAASASKFKGLCPFHSERTPSFTVDSHFQNYKCFGCQAGGDVLSFIEKYEHLDFRDAVQKLADEHGIEIKRSGDEVSLDYKSIRECIRAAANFYLAEFRKLPEDHAAVLEVTNRGLPLKGMTRYGYAPEGRRTLYLHLKELGFGDEIITHTGVCKAFESDPGKLFDFWHGRLMFVFTDAAGKPIGFSGRKLFEESDKRGKYVNSSDGPLFDKSSVLFNHANAKKKASDDSVIYVAEGQFDVAAIAETGSVNVVASSGTAFTKTQALMCSRMVGGEGKIVFCFDGDTAGRKAAMKVFATSPETQSQTYVVSMPDGMDPCDFRLKNGNEALVDQLENKRVPLVEFVLDYEAAKYDFTDPSQAARFIEHSASILATISNRSLRSYYAKRTALQTQMSIEEIQQAVNAAHKLKPESVEAESIADSAPAETVAEARGEEVAESELDFIDKIRADEMYADFASLAVLALSDDRFVSALAKADSFPKMLRSVMIQRLDEIGGPVISETYNHPELVRFLTSGELIGMLDEMDSDDRADYFLETRDRALDELESRKFMRYAKGVMSTLSVDSENGIDMLKMAVNNDPTRSTDNESKEGD